MPTTTLKDVLQKISPAFLLKGSNVSEKRGKALFDRVRGYVLLDTMKGNEYLKTERPWINVYLQHVSDTEKNNRVFNNILLY